MESVPAEHGLHAETGLSNDYLNQFNEAVMLLDMIADMPECLEDLNAWQPQSYVEHFQASQLHWAGYAIATFEALDPPFREAFEACVANLDTGLSEATQTLNAWSAEGTLGERSDAIAMLATDIHSRVGRLNDFIMDGEATKAGGAQSAPHAHDDAQSLADALF